jgi:hypothetical protein
MRRQPAVSGDPHVRKRVGIFFVETIVCGQPDFRSGHGWIIPALPDGVVHKTKKPAGADAAGWLSIRPSGTRRRRASRMRGA